MVLLVPFRGCEQLWDDFHFRKQFEIIVTLEGITPETGNTVQAREQMGPASILSHSTF